MFNKYLKIFLIIAVIITNAFSGVNFSLAAGTQTSSLSKGLIAHFPLNRATKQSATTFKDTTPYARIGTITPGASAGLSTDQKGLTGGSYGFTGNTKIDTGSQWIGQQAFSISAWVYRTADTGRIISQPGGTGYLGLAAGEVKFSQNASQEIITTGTKVPNNTWVHIVATATNSNPCTGIIYVNGVWAVSGNIATVRDTGSNVIIGNNTALSSGVTGKISDVLVYNRVLTASEIKNLYKSYGPVAQTNSLDKGLIAAFPLNRATKQSATTFKDTTPYARTGTITAGGSAGLSTDQKGLAGGAYDFDGADTRINTGSDFIGVQPVTISAWIYLDSYGEGGVGRILTNGRTELVTYGPGTALQFRSDGAANNFSAATLSLNIWTYVAVTRTSAGVANFYINGILSGSANQNSGAPVAGTTNVFIGNANNPQQTLDGRISDLKVYNRVLTATEVKNLYKSYNAGLTTKCSGLVDSRDGKIYQTIQIGNQCWMAQNLNIGTQVNSPASASVTAACTGHIGETLAIDGTSCYCETADYASCQLNGVNGTIQKYCYSNTASMCTAEGGLYEWQQTMNLASSCAHSSCTPASGNKGICPVGWHVPTDIEYKTLEINQGMSQAQADTTSWRGTTEGDKLKGAGLCQGRIPCATSDFKGLLAGHRNVTGAFNNRSSSALFWSSSQSSAAGSWYRYLYVSISTVRRGTDDKYYGFSVRCIKD